MHLQLSSSQHCLLTPEENRSNNQAAADRQRNEDMASRVAALLLLGVLCFSFAAGEIAVDCCLQATDKRVHSKSVVDYIIQEAGKGCSISATVLFTNTGRSLCVLHPSQKQWVKNIIDIVNKKKQSQQ